MKIAYETNRLTDASLAKVERINAIIEEYQAQGFTLTLRQLYYQHVARGFIANNEREYKKLGDVVANGRLCGLIDWEAITDRTRFLRKQASWSSPIDIVEACATQFRLPKWDDQPAYVEVWIEKDALLGVIEGLCNDFDVPYLACRGYASASELWSAGHQRFRAKLRAKKRCHVLYLGDHDPSGIDMARDVQDRLDLFTHKRGAVKVERLALNFEQVEEHTPPPNPTKLSDSRAGAYLDKFGEECWELDALEPAVIADLIRTRIEELLDDARWQDACVRETTAKADLANVAEKWGDILDWLKE